MSHHMTPDRPAIAVTRSYKGASIEERQHLRRERLVEAAFEAFARRGIAKTTIRDICAEARLTERYFYESFRSTEDAFDAVYLHLKCQLVARVTEALSHAPKSTIPLASAGLRAFYIFLREDPRRAQVVLIDAFSANQQSSEKSQKAVHEYIELMRGLTFILCPDWPKSLDFEMIGGGLLGLAIQVGTLWARSGFNKSIDEILSHNLYAWQGLEDRVLALTSQAPAKRKSPALKSVGPKRATPAKKAPL